MRRRAGLLALEDGRCFAGEAWGEVAIATGEICFNTGMAGYQEVLTDPSYHGQIVTMTAPQIGNTGVNDEDDQSRRPWVAGFVARDFSATHSSWRATRGLDGYLRDHRVPALSEVDTRAVTRHIRTRGAMRAALSTEDASAADLVEMARRSPSLVGLDLAREVTTAEAYESPFVARGGDGPTLRVAAFDFGVKKNILEQLACCGCEVVVVPASTTADAVVNAGYDAVFLSNGPGDPEPVAYAVESVRELLGRVPIFGICLGHQIFGLALGARTFKLPFGHRGANHPVQRVDDGGVEITCQNHGFAVDPQSLAGTGASPTHFNLNDGTLEGLSVPGIGYSVQYHPEAGPGPHDARYLFGRMRDLVEGFRPRDDERRVTSGTR